jgi:type IV secretory pathway VirB4 component
MNINEVMIFSPFCPIFEHFGQNRGFVLNFLLQLLQKKGRFLFSCKTDHMTALLRGNATLRLCKMFIGI